jgi:chromosomal replication initiation ATPase DnaA
VTSAALHSLGELFDATRATSGRDVAIEQLAKAIATGKYRTPPSAGVPPAIEALFETIAMHYGYALADLRRHEFSRQRSNNQLARIRGEAVYVARALSNVSFPTLGKYFGGRHHATLMSACEKFAERLEVDEVLRRRIARIVGEAAAAEERAVA